MTPRYVGLTSLTEALEKTGRTFKVQHPRVIIEEISIQCPILGKSGIYIFFKKEKKYLQVKGIENVLKKINFI